jgi:hypothetical protein
MEGIIDLRTYYKKVEEREREENRDVVVSFIYLVSPLS